MAEDRVERLVVGGGLAGLILAIACAEAGLAVALVDREAPARMLGEAFDGPGTYNCDRIMRVPGTWNWPTPANRCSGGWRWKRPRARKSLASGAIPIIPCSPLTMSRNWRGAMGVLSLSKGW